MDAFWKTGAPRNSLLELSIADWVLDYLDLDNDSSDAVIDHLDRFCRSILSSQATENEPYVRRLVELLFAIVESRNDARLVSALLDCGFFYSRIGRSAYGRTVVERLLCRYIDVGNFPAFRRAHNLLGVMRLDAADFESALLHLESALSYAYKMEDPLQVTPCLANAVAALMEMGHYNDAMRVAISILKVGIDHPMIRILKFQSATNGLFCAHRTQSAPMRLNSCPLVMSY